MKNIFYVLCCNLFFIPIIIATMIIVKVISMIEQQLFYVYYSSIEYKILKSLSRGIS